MHRDVDWRPQSYCTCQPRKEISGVCTHCKVESWSANWWKITRCYGLVISCMSGPFRSFCRYQAHSLRVHLCRIQGRQKSRQPQRYGRVQIPWKEELRCRQKLVLLFYCSWHITSHASKNSSKFVYKFLNYLVKRQTNWKHNHRQPWRRWLLLRFVTYSILFFSKFYPVALEE